MPAGDIGRRRRRQPSLQADRQPSQDIYGTDRTIDLHEDYDNDDIIISKGLNGHPRHQHPYKSSRGSSVLEGLKLACRSRCLQLTRSLGLDRRYRARHDRRRNFDSKGILWIVGHLDYQNRLDRSLGTAAIVLLLLSLYALNLLPSFGSGLVIAVGRPLTESSADRLPLLISNFDFANFQTDLGGWDFFHKFHRPLPLDLDEISLTTSRKKTLEMTKVKQVQPKQKDIKDKSKGKEEQLEEADLDPNTPDFGGLTFLGRFGKPRETRPNDALFAERDWEVAHPDHKKMKKYDMFSEDLADIESACKRQDWHFLYHPSCNAMHELDLTYDFNPDRAGIGDDQMFDSFYISHGFYRDVWVVHQVQQDVKSILKTIRWKHEATISNFLSILRDALVMERLTKSSRIVDIFGHCANSVWVEALPYELEQIIVPGDGYMKQKDLKDEFELNPQNDYTAEEKLDIAISMAESIADLHGFEDGLIVHDDVQLCQWLRTKEGILKLGDFNRAEIPEFNPATGKYCKYNNGHGFGNYRAPEEFAAQDLDEKIDVFSFGNNIYGLLTGLWPFYENEDDEVVQKKLIGGETAFIDPRYRTRSFIEGKLVEITEKCWKFNPDDRPDIFQLVKMLHQVKDEYEKLNPPSKSNEGSEKIK